MEKYAHLGAELAQRPVPARGKHFRGFLLCDGQAAHRRLHPRGIRRDLAGVHLLPVHDDAGGSAGAAAAHPQAGDAGAFAGIRRVRAGTRRHPEGGHAGLFGRTAVQRPVRFLCQRGSVPAQRHGFRYQERGRDDRRPQAPLQPRPSGQRLRRKSPKSWPVRNRNGIAKGEHLL